ncbi:adenosine 5'-monophosphoramidase HINT3-like isoform X3 [Crassostrea virginica]
MSTSVCDKCIFCKIANLQDHETRILYQDDEFVAINDIRPAADQHYLIITKQHIRDPKHLKGSDLDLLERLVATGEKVLKDAGGNIEEASFLLDGQMAMSCQRLVTTSTVSMLRLSSRRSDSGRAQGQHDED